MRASRIKSAWAVPPPSANLVMFSIDKCMVKSQLRVGDAKGIDRFVALSINYRYCRQVVPSREFESLFVSRVIFLLETKNQSASCRKTRFSTVS